MKKYIFMLSIILPLFCLADTPSWVESMICEEELCAVGVAKKSEGREKARVNALRELSAQIGTNISSLTSINIKNGKEKSSVNISSDAGYKNISSQIIAVYESKNQIFVKVKYLGHDIISQSAMILGTLQNANEKEKACLSDDDYKTCETIGIAYYLLSDKNINDKADRFLKKACDKGGYPRSCYYLGEYYMSYGDEEEYVYKEQYYRKACSGNIKEACLIILANSDEDVEVAYYDMLTLAKVKEVKQMLNDINIAKFGCVDPSSCRANMNNDTKNIYKKLCFVNKEPFACDIIGEDELSIKYANRGAWFEPRIKKYKICSPTPNFYFIEPKNCEKKVKYEEAYDVLRPLCYNDELCLDDLKSVSLANMRYPSLKRAIDRYIKDNGIYLTATCKEDEFCKIDSTLLLKDAHNIMDAAFINLKNDN